MLKPSFTKQFERDLKRQEEEKASLYFVFRW